MQSDTIIGIVGAVVLVSVMVGVFAYEYNNVDTDEPTEAEQQAQREADFAAMYDSLDPNGDLDGDGVSNVNETDLDGDGINNTEDDVFEYSRDFDAGGSIAAAPNAAPYSLTFEAEEGLRHVMLSLSHPERVAGDQTALALTVELAANGETRTATASVSGGVATYTIDWMDVGPGTYTLTVSPFTAGGALAVDPGTQVEGALTFHYGPF